MARTLLITGGAGYIGSHTALLMHQSGDHIIVLDQLLHGQTFHHPWATFIKGDVGDRALLDHIFSTYAIDAVMHFAAFIEVGESVKNPLGFYHNNVSNSVTLLEAMRDHHVQHIVFSSTCAVYGSPHIVPIPENHPLEPASPYGATKKMVEEILADAHRAHGIGYVALRYFNVGGALPEHELHEQHVPETHLIPLLIRAAYSGKPFYIFGTDYDTHDGTCVRDFLHVLDVAHAHKRALDYLMAGGQPAAFNLGTGTGFSVREMVTTVAQLTKHPIYIEETVRRAGDPAVLVADYTLAQTVLGWQPCRSTRESIIESALRSQLQIWAPEKIEQKGQPEGHPLR